MLQHYDRTRAGMAAAACSSILYVGRLTQRWQPAAAALSAITENRINNPHSQLQLAKLFAVSAHLVQHSTELLTVF